MKKYFTFILIATVIVCTGAIAAPVHAQPSVSVLCYHSFIDKKKKDPYCFSVDELGSHVNQLKDEGFKFVSVSDIMHGRVTGTRNVLITVDDGNRSVIEAYRKVFRPNGIRPLLGVYPNIIVNKKKYALAWEELRELANAGCDIAAHGYYHLKISEKLRDESPGDFRKEIYASKKLIEEKLGRRITAFVYPFGMRDDAAINALKDAGYRYAFTIDRGRIDLPVAGYGDRLFELPRYMVTREGWSYCFTKVLQNARPRQAVRVAAAGKSRSPLSDTAEPKDIRSPERDDREARAWKAERGGERMTETAFLKDPGEARDPRHKSRGRGESFFAAGDDDRITVASPVQRVLSSVRRDVLEPGSADIFPPPGGEPSTAGFFEPSTSGAGPDMPAITDDGIEMLKGKVSGDWSNYHPKMKYQYRKISSRTLETYHDVFGIVKGKIERLKRRIRSFVSGNF